MESMAKAMPIKVIKKIKEKDRNVIKESDKKIRSLSNYKFIKKRYEPLYDKIISTRLKSLGVKWLRITQLSQKLLFCP